MHSHVLQLSFMIFVFVHPTHPLTPLSIHIYNQSGCIYYHLTQLSVCLYIPHCQLHGSPFCACVYDQSFMIPQSFHDIISLQIDNLLIFQFLEIYIYMLFFIPLKENLEIIKNKTQNQNAFNHTHKTN